MTEYARVGNTQAEDKIRDLESFRTRTERDGLWGTDVKDDMTSIGQLEGADLIMYEAARSNGTLVYVVYSYTTPIAWLMTSGEMISPDVKYSQTTSQHQRIARYALGI